MILNVIKEGGSTSNNTDKLKLISKENNIDNVQLKKIKELLSENDLRYVSNNVRDLLNLTKENDSECFKDYGRVKKVIQSGEKFRVILYIRLSREDGDLENNDVSGSIKNQLIMLLDECAKKDWCVVGIFCEEDLSGVDDNRPEWLKLIRFAEVGNTEIVLCKSQSRFTRSMEMVEKYLHKEFPEWNIRFLGLMDNVDTNVVENKKTRQINGLVNEWYVEDVSNNTRATLESMKRQGLFTGSFAPYGYQIDPKDKHHLVPDPYARKAIKIMAGMLKHGKGLPLIIEVLMRKNFLTPADYKTYQGIPINRGQLIKEIEYQVEEGETLKTIAHKYYVTVDVLKEKNNLKTNKVNVGDVIKIPYKQKWTNAMIRKILTDETQVGSLVQGKRQRTSFKNKKIRYKPKEEWIIVPHCHEANLDLETFEIVSSMLTVENKIRSQKNGEINIFSKKVYCSCCGKALNKNTAKVKSGTRVYLQCKGHQSTGGHLCDNSETIRFEELKDYILEQIKNKIDEYFDLSKINEEYYSKNVYSNIDNDIKVLENERANINIELNKQESLLTQLYTDKVSGVITEEEFSIIKRKKALDGNALRTRLLDIDNEIHTLNQSKSKQTDKEQLFKKYKDINELNKVILDAFISKIEIGKTTPETLERPINIEWNLYTV